MDLKEKISNNIVNEKIREYKSDDTIKIIAIEQRYVNCNKPNCSKCPHGAYIFIKYMIKGERKIFRDYIGRIYN